MSKPRRELRTGTLGGREVRYTVTVSPTASKARIRVGPAGVEVIVPRSAGPGRALEFLAEQADWVLAQLDRLERLGSIRSPVREADPGTILFRGERVPVRVVAADTCRRFALVGRAEQGITVTVPTRGGVDAAAAVERWLRREARAAAEARVLVWARALKRTPNRVYIRGQRTKWGNCSALGNLSLNWRLVMAPERVLDAIVIHELAHLIEPTHQARFWLIVRSHCPDYDARVRWLTENHSALFDASLAIRSALVA